MTFFRDIRIEEYGYHNPEDWFPCTDEEAKYRDKLVREAEKQCAKKVGTSPGFIPPLPPLPK